MLKHIRWDEVELENLNPKLARQYVNSGGVTVARLLMQSGLRIPTHHHPNEQITTVISGAIRMWLGGDEYEVRAGETLCIPANQPHQTEALEDTVCLDIFSPARADWVAGKDAYLRGGEAVAAVDA